MITRPAIIVLSEREAVQSALASALEAEGRLEVIACVSDPAALAGLVALHSPTALLLAFEEKGDLLLDAVEALPLPRPPFVAFGPEQNGRHILRAMRLGAREFLPLDAAASALRASFEGIENVGPDRVAEPQGVILAVLGAKGGAGATFVASQLALALRRLSGETALVDLSLRHGDASLHLDLKPTYTIADVARREGPLDATYLSTVLQLHRSGVRVLAAPARPEEAELVQAGRVAETLRLARGMHDWVVLDLGREFDEVSLRALDLADEILLVSTRDIPSLHHTQRVLGLLERLGHPASRVRLLMNRCVRVAAVGERDAAAYLGREPDARLPNDWTAAQETANYGRPLAEAAPRSPLTAALAELARQVHEWRGLPRPTEETSGSPVARVRSYVQRKLRGSD